jgi:hypothetical protein
MEPEVKVFLSGIQSFSEELPLHFATEAVADGPWRDLSSMIESTSESEVRWVNEEVLLTWLYWIFQQLLCAMIQEWWQVEVLLIGFAGCQWDWDHPLKGSHQSFLVWWKVGLVV